MTSANITWYNPEEIYTCDIDDETKNRKRKQYSEQEAESAKRTLIRAIVDQEAEKYIQDMKMIDITCEALPFNTCYTDSRDTIVESYRYGFFLYNAQKSLPNGSDIESLYKKLSGPEEEYPREEDYSDDDFYYNTFVRAWCIFGRCDHRAKKEFDRLVDHFYYARAEQVLEEDDEDEDEVKQEEEEEKN